MKSYNNPLAQKSFIFPTDNYTMNKIRGKTSAFTLVEILIVVTILGILAAIVFPEYRAHAQKAKESTAKENLQILRSTIERYAVQHKDYPPGYLNGESAPEWVILLQLTSYTDAVGNAAGAKSANFPYGPYLKEIPENIFNNKTTIQILDDDASFPESADGNSGWIYKPKAKTIKLNWLGTDSKGKRYYDY